MKLTLKAKKAVEDSIKHWMEDIVGPMREGRKVSVRSDSPYWEDTGYFLPVGTSDCSLCEEYYKHNLLGDNCDDCPLQKSGNGCEDKTKTSSWKKFNKDPTLPHALNMVKALEEILEGK